jgi:hypothetical protein
VSIALNDGMRSVRDIGDELYQLPPADFTKARDRQVAEARQSGDREAATELAALKRPSVSAWLVNLLALRDPQALGRLIDLGESIRAAQGSVPPQQLRDLSAQRRSVLDATVARAQALAREAGGAEPSRAHLAEAESTLSAAMADESAAELVRSGRVLKPVSYSGFGQEGLGGFGPVPRTGAATRAPDRPPRAGAKAPSAGTVDWAEAASEAAQALADRQQAAQAKVDQAQSQLDDAAAAERAANDLAERLTAEINDLRARLDETQREARQARAHRMATERELAAAQRRLDRLQ